MSIVEEVEILESYELGGSLAELASRYNTYPQKIRRIVLKHGRKMRTHSEAQTLNLQKGGSHPTKGRHRTDAEKDYISEQVSKSWDGITEEERENRLAPMQNGLKKEKKKGSKIMDKAKANMKATTEKGSKLEHYLLERLKKDGFKVQHHYELIIKNDHMHYDIVLLGSPIVAIEVDGPTHHRPIFGEERLAKQQESDNRKDMLTLSAKLHMVRVYGDYTNMSRFKKNQLYDNLKSILLSLKGDTDYRVSKVDKI